MAPPRLTRAQSLGRRLSGFAGGKRAMTRKLASAATEPRNSGTAHECAPGGCYAADVLSPACHEAATRASTAGLPPPPQQQMADSLADGACVSDSEQHAPAQSPVPGSSSPAAAGGGSARCSQGGAATCSTSAPAIDVSLSVLRTEVRVLDGALAKVAELRCGCAVFADLADPAAARHAVAEVVVRRVSADVRAECVTAGLERLCGVVDAVAAARTPATARDKTAHCQNRRSAEAAGPASPARAPLTWASSVAATEGGALRLRTNSSIHGSAMQHADQEMLREYIVKADGLSACVSSAAAVPAGAWSSETSLPTAAPAEDTAGSGTTEGTNDTPRAPRHAQSRSIQSVLEYGSPEVCTMEYGSTEVYTMEFGSPEVCTMFTSLEARTCVAGGASIRGGQNSLRYCSYAAAGHASCQCVPARGRGADHRGPHRRARAAVWRRARGVSGSVHSGRGDWPERKLQPRHCAHRCSRGVRCAHVVYRQRC